MTLAPSDRAAIVRSARAHADTWYVWGGNSWDGADCSGWVQLVLHDAGIHPWASRFPFRHDDTCATAWATWEPVDVPEVGDVAFYDSDRNGKPDHMVLATEVVRGVVMEVIGSSKGDSGCTSVEIAKQKGARVVTRRKRNAHLFRRDFCGWRRPVIRAAVVGSAA